MSKEFNPDIFAGRLSLIIPGLGQLSQRRFLMAGVQISLAIVLWQFWLGWIIHIWSAYDAKRLWVHDSTPSNFFDRFNSYWW